MLECILPQRGLIPETAPTEIGLKILDILFNASARMTVDIETIAELAIMNGGNEIRAETQPSPFVERLLVFLGTVVGTWLLFNTGQSFARK